MQTKGEKLDDLQGGDTTMRMEQMREVMTVNQEIKNELNWACMTSEQRGCRHGRKLQKWALETVTDFIWNTKRE